MPQIFTSHATEDDPIVTRIHNALSAAGIDVWVDHLDGIGASDSWPHQIDAACKSCEAGLFVMSETALQSRYCTAEYHDIWGAGKRLYIALIEPVKAIPVPLNIIQYVNLIGDQFDSGIMALIKAMTNGRDLDQESIAVAQALRVTGYGFPRGSLDVPISGREAELTAVKRAFADRSRVTALLGIGGVGKTRLAAEIAVTGDFRDGVIWHRIDSLTTVDRLTEQIREHLTLDKTTNDDSTWAALANRQALIVLDNAEDCAATKAYAQRLATLDLAGGTRVLMTSRVEWADLRGVKRIDLHAPSLAAAEQIVKDMAQQEPPAFSLEGYERRLADSAHCHPRLIEFAVHWANSYPVDYVLEQLRTLKGADVQETLDEMIRRTIQQVEQHENGKEAIAALRRLAVCRGGFTFEVARALMGGSADPRLLALLRGWGLVNVTAQRYDIDPLVLAVVEEDESAFQAHYDYYLALAKKQDAKQDYAGLEAETLNLEAAFERALLDGERVEQAYWLADTCHQFLRNRGRFLQVADWVERAARQLNEHTDPQLRGAVLHKLGAVHINLAQVKDRAENLRRAIAYITDALAYRTPQTSPLDYAKAQNNLGIAYQNLAEIEGRAENLRQSIACFHEALAYYIPQTAALDYAMTQNNLGTAYFDLAGIEDRAENLRRTIECYRAALIYYVPEIAPLDYAMTQSNLGMTYTDLAGIEERAENLRRAIESYRAALVYLTPQTAPLDYARVQNNLGNVYVNLATEESPAENLRHAIDCFREALVFRTPQAAPLSHALTQYNLGNTYLSLSKSEAQSDNLQRAVACYHAALLYQTPQSAPLDYAGTQRNLGIALELLGDLKRAIAAWREAQQCYHQMGAAKNEVLVQAWIADVEQRLHGNTEG